MRDGVPLQIKMRNIEMHVANSHPKRINESSILSQRHTPERDKVAIKGTDNTTHAHRSSAFFRGLLRGVAIVFRATEKLVLVKTTMLCEVSSNGCEVSGRRSIA